MINNYPRSLDGLLCKDHNEIIWAGSWNPSLQIPFPHQHIISWGVGNTRIRQILDVLLLRALCTSPLMWCKWMSACTPCTAHHQHQTQTITNRKQKQRKIYRRGKIGAKSREAVPGSTWLSCLIQADFLHTDPTMINWKEITIPYWSRLQKI